MKSSIFTRDKRVRLSSFFFLKLLQKIPILKFYQFVKIGLEFITKVDGFLDLISI